MTKKDFILLANALHTARIVCADDSEDYVWAQCCSAVASALKQENPRFDVDKFIGACMKGVKK